MWGHDDYFEGPVAGRVPFAGSGQLAVSGEAALLPSGRGPGTAVGVPGVHGGADFG